MAVSCPKCNANNPETVKFCAECGTRMDPSGPPQGSGTRTFETPTGDLTRGTVFAGRYEIIEELGQGGMGRVYRAFDKKIKEEVAIKFLRPEIAADARTIERFSSEIRFARRITHRNVCRMYDLHEEGTTSFITMEYVAGEDLKGLLAQTKPLAVGTALSIAGQIAEGLAEAHRLGLVHRDLKPANIMIDKEGRAKIMDFGIARAIAGAGVTGEGAIIGTPEYMSPEQVEGIEADQRSDIYSLGIILFEMLTGKVPFAGDTPLAVGIKQKTEPPRPPKEMNPQIPERLNRLILGCLDKERERRIQSAEEVFSELAETEESLPTSERSSVKGKITRAKGITRRARRVRAASFVAVAAAAAFLLIVFRAPLGRNDVPPKKNKMLVVLPFENLGLPEDEYFADGMTDELTNRFSSLYGLDVISRASAIQYKKTNKTIKQIRRELNVDYALTGTVRWEKAPGQKGRVRISPQLIQASRDTQVWSKTYEQPAENIFSVQAGIAEEVAKQLDITLLEPDRKAIEAKPTNNPEAYDYCLRAMSHFERGWKQGEADGFQMAVELAEKAIALDPNYVGAYLVLSNTHSTLFHIGKERTDERLARSKAALDRALEIEPNMPEANELLAWHYYRGFRDYDRAIEILESVQKARPNYPPYLMGNIKKRQGKWEESLACFERVFRLDPRAYYVTMEIALVNTCLRRYEEAVGWYDRGLSIAPDYIWNRLNRGDCYFMWKGDLDEYRASLGSFPPGRSDEADLARLWVEINGRNYKEALDRLGSIPFDAREEQNYYWHKDLAYAEVLYGLKEIPPVRLHADLARKALEIKARERPDDPRYRSALGRAYAYLGRKEEAIREGNQAVNLCPVSKDAMFGPTFVYDLAHIEAIVGEHRSAIDRLDYLMSIPAGMVVSAASLRNDIAWDPLRSDPGFEALLKKYREKK